MESYGIIYLITFTNNNKKYVGQTTQGLEKRWKEHLRTSKKKTKNKLRFHNAINKYQEYIKKEIIAEAYSPEELDELEKRYILEYNTFDENFGYNMTFGGEGCKGYKFTDEQKKRCREIQQKRKDEHPEIAENHRIFMRQRAIENPEIGINHSKVMKKMYDENPEKRMEMSILKKKQYEENPEMREEMSLLKRRQYEDNEELREKIKSTVLEQWKNPEKRERLMNEKRKRFERRFHVYHINGEYLESFEYVPDCAKKLFGKEQASNISAVLKGRRNSYKGYTFRYENDSIE
jgi:group I intron endonuclease